MHASTRQTFLIPNGEPNSVVSALKNLYVYTVGACIFAYCVIFDFLAIIVQGLLSLDLWFLL